MKLIDNIVIEEQTQKDNNNYLYYVHYINEPL